MCFAYLFSHGHGNFVVFGDLSRIVIILRFYHLFAYFAKSPSRTPEHRSAARALQAADDKSNILLEISRKRLSVFSILLILSILHVLNKFNSYQSHGCTTNNRHRYNAMPYWRTVSNATET